MTIPWNYQDLLLRATYIWGDFWESCCFCCRSGPVLVGLGALRTRFWRVPGGSGEGFGGPKAFFFYVFSHTLACNAKKPRICKNHNLSKVFLCFLHIASDAQNRFRNLSRSTSQKDHAQNLSWVSPASLLEGLGWSGSFPVCILAPLDAPELDFGGFGALPGWVLEGFGGMFWHALCCPWPRAS